MADRPNRRPRPDSKQMWDEAESRRAPRDQQDRGGDRRDDRNRDQDRNRDRRYRSRSPRDSRGGGRDRERERGGRRDDRERGDDRGNRERDGDHGRDRVRETRERDHTARDGGRDPRERPRERSRDKHRDSGRDARSRSPRRDKDRDMRGGPPVGKDIPKPTPVEPEFTEARTETPPVSFKVGATNGQDHDRMEVDAEAAQPAKKGKKGKKVAKPVDEDDDIVVEDDGMAAMQAMMGFGDFGTTHQKKVAGNDISAVRKEKKTEYRQYMNRVGGFNRPLSPSRE